MKKSHLAERAFSLIECVIALGVVSFAFVTLIGLLPMGLQQFELSQEQSVRSEIEKYLDTQVQESPFSTLTTATPGQGGMQGAQYAFDAEGFPVSYGATNQLYIATTTVAASGVSLPSTSLIPNTNLVVINVVIQKQTAAMTQPSAQTNAVLSIYASDRGQ